MAYQLDAKRIILIGYDMQHTGGQSHWHGDHPKGLGNAQNIAGWVHCFRKLADDLKAENVELINATAKTALTFLDCRDLKTCF